MLYLKVLITLVLLYIAWQDFKFRAVYWWLFVVLVMVLGIAKSLATNVQLMATDLLYNCIFLGVQLLFLSAYFSIKTRKLVNIFNGFLGLGDLFFLISVAAYFSWLNYIVYYLLSLFVVMMMSLIGGFFLKAQNPKIPLAGGQAMILIVLMLIAQFNTTISLTTDAWIVNHLIL